jgi:hypothetical protein
LSRRSSSPRWAGRWPAPTVYCGVFVAVAALELYGTAIGTWRWAEVIPGLGLPDGNPPSGVASGYVLFDVLALAAAPALVRLARPWAPSFLTMGEEISRR